MTQALHWRALTMLDLPTVEAIAAKAHPGFPEDTSVLGERLRLYPDGARLLEHDGVAAGYILSHPWMAGTIPALNTLLGALPMGADTYYVHDLALLNPARGTGAAAMIVGDLLRHARSTGFTTVSLVAVNDSGPFWYKHGFRVVAAPQFAGKLASYDDKARYMSRAV